MALKTDYFIGKPEFFPYSYLVLISLLAHTKNHRQLFFYFFLFFIFAGLFRVKIVFRILYALKSLHIFE